MEGRMRTERETGPTRKTINEGHGSKLDFNIFLTFLSLIEFGPGRLSKAKHEVGRQHR